MKSLEMLPGHSCGLTSKLSLEVFLEDFGHRRCMNKVWRKGNMSVKESTKPLTPVPSA